MTSTSKQTGINDNMSLVAAAVLVPLMMFLAFKLFSVLKEDSDAEAARLAKREQKKGRKGSKKE